MCEHLKVIARVRLSDKRPQTNLISDCYLTKRNDTSPVENRNFGQAIEYTYTIIYVYTFSASIAHHIAHTHTHMTLIYLTHPALSAVPENKRYMLHYATSNTCDDHYGTLAHRTVQHIGNGKASSAKPTSTSISLLFPFPSVQRPRKYDEHGTGSGCRSNALSVPVC